MSSADPTTTGAQAFRNSGAAPTPDVDLLLRRLEFQRLLGEVSSHLIALSAEQIDEHINWALKRVGSFLGFNLVAISKFSGQGNAGEVTHVWAADGLPPMSPGFTELDFPWAAERLIQGHTVLLASLDDLPAAGQRDRQTLESLDIRSAYNWPLQVGGATVGNLGLASVGETRPFPAGFEEEMELLVQILAGALARQRADTALRESEARLSMAADAAEAGFWTLNPATSRFWLTKKARELFGFGVEEVVTFDRFLSLVHPDDQELVREVAQKLMQSKQEGHVEYRIVKADGSVHWMLSRGRIQFDKSSRTECLMGVSVDVTKRKLAELEAEELRGQLARAGRVTMLGQLASALAHELSQPIGAILRNAEAAELMLQSPSPDLEELLAIVRDIVSDDQRTGQIIDRLRSLLKWQNIDLQPTELPSIIAGVLSLVHAEAVSRNVRLVCTVAPGLPLVCGDSTHLQQVLINLIVNAMDALDDCPSAQRDIQVIARQIDPGTVEVRVCDNGPGIPVESVARLFEPFFTTKTNGMGMGLTISKSIIEAHNGKLWAENRPEGGACFRFTLRVSQGNR